MPNDFDKILKENFDELVPHLLSAVLGLHFPKLENIKDKHQITLEREMDNLKKVVHPDAALDYGLHWEIQTNDEDMRARNLLYFAIFYQKYKIPLKQIVIYIGNEPARKILNDTLDLEDIRLKFTVVDLKTIPKDVFLHSDKPETVILAILSDFGSDKPELVVRQILQHLLQLIGRVPRLKKYQKQLHVLSRLRKLTTITKNEIKNMPIHYEIETDELYLEGIEKGIEQGIEKGILETKTASVVSMLKARKYTISDIVSILDVTEHFVRNIAHQSGMPILE